MIASAVLLYANCALRTVLGVGGDVVGRFTVIGALRQPPFDGDTVSWRVIIVAATKAKARLAHFTRRLFGTCVRASKDCLTVGAGTEAQLGM